MSSPAGAPTPLPRVQRAAAALAGAWNRFWFGEVDALPFAAVRIGVALAGLQLWVGTLPLLGRYYSDAGEFPIVAARAWGSEYFGRFLMPDPLGSLGASGALFAVWLIALGALLVGWRTRGAALLSAFLTHWFYFRNPTFLNGGDEALRLVSLYLAAGYLALPPADCALTLDRKQARRGTPGSSARMPAWPLRLVQIQLCTIYFVSGFWKTMGDTWWDGSALYYALGNPAFSRFGITDAAWLRPLAAPLTLTLAWWEVLFPLLVLRERTRLWALGFGAAVHLTILATMNIGVFPFIMLGLYPAFLRGEELRWFGALVVRLVGRVRRATAPRQAVEAWPGR